MDEVTMTVVIDEIKGPAIVVAWDPELIDEDTYAELVNALGDVIRSHGGNGLAMLESSSIGASVEQGAVL